MSAHRFNLSGKSAGNPPDPLAEFLRGDLALLCRPEHQALGLANNLDRPAGPVYERNASGALQLATSRVILVRSRSCSSRTHRTPDVVQFAVSPQVGQAVLAFARSYLVSVMKLPSSGKDRLLARAARKTPR
jgi:hypothetical protein